MTDSAGIKNQALEELDTLRQEIARLQTMSAEYHATEAKLAQLVIFPERNPDILVETDVNGRVTYLNLVAQARFPEIWQQGFDHALLQGLAQIVQSMERSQQSYSADEINLSKASFERQICCSWEPDAVRIRIYAHDITRRKRAELAIHRLAKQVVYAQEEERRRLSRELHDEAGQALTALKLSLELLRADLPVDTEVLSRNLAEAIALTESTKERVRLLAHGLRPPALDTVGLNLTLEALCRDFSKRTRLVIHYLGYEAKELSDAMNICLYRVLQEALTNVVKHACAGQVDVCLSREAGCVRLMVTDDGRGIEPAAQQLLEQRVGIGLLGMRERLELLGGWLDVESVPGQGLRLAANLPLSTTS
jgi:signal transduction histidine kinase